MTPPARPAAGTRRGISFFGPPAEAPGLGDTDMMSMPELDPPAIDQFMELVQGGGNAVKVLYRNDTMSLVWVWYAPNYALPRHSHDVDCLYFVVSGEAHLGNRTVAAGAGFFVPAGAPYAYSAGPEGVQVLEFRGAPSFDMKITESLDRWDQILETVRTNRDAWKEAVVGDDHPPGGPATVVASHASGVGGEEPVS